MRLIIAISLVITSLAFLTLHGCGNSSLDNEAIGQVKKVVANTPILCGNYHDVDISLGVMRNGVGSMSTSDEWFYVTNPQALEVLKKANENGKLVRVHYGVSRVPVCREDHWLTDAEIIE